MLELESNYNDRRLDIQLADTEASILSAASRIYAAYIASGQISAGEEDRYMQMAVKQVVYMAALVDDRIKAEGEL